MRPSAAATPGGHACIVTLPPPISYFPSSNDYVLLFHFSSSSRRISRAPSLLLLSPPYLLPLSFPSLDFPLFPKGRRELEHSLLPPQKLRLEEAGSYMFIKTGRYVIHHNYLHLQDTVSTRRCSKLPFFPSRCPPVSRGASCWRSEQLAVNTKGLCSSRPLFLLL